MTLLHTTSAATLGLPTISFYIGGNHPEHIRLCADHTDAIVVSGPAGPTSVRTLRKRGWSGSALFDLVGYLKEPRTVDVSAWIAEQRSAGCDRALTPGQWVGVNPGGPDFSDQIASEVALASAHGATCLIAIDRRWLTESRKFDEMSRALRSVGVPAAIVLGATGDPLGYQGAVNSLVALASNVENLTLLRIDHGGIGGLAFGAVHASIGLRPGHRHAVPPGAQGGGIPNDRTARIFVVQLMDWFTASTIGGWSTVKVPMTCNDDCCNGQELVRFLDGRNVDEAEVHNRTVLMRLAEQILEIPESADRRRTFGSLCAKALDRYGPMGNLVNATKPKSQLEQWASFA